MQDQPVYPNLTQLSQVLGYNSLNWPIIDIPYRDKNPGRAGWQAERLNESELIERFAQPRNVGLLLGLGPASLKPSTPDDITNGIVDIDLDTPEAVAIAPNFLPRTNSIFGRRGKPNSHYLYRMERPAKTKKWVDPIAPKDQGTLVEFRSTGAYTVIPTSWHKDTGQEIQWAPGADCHPPKVTWEEIEHALNRIASVAILCRHWRTSGGRHDAALFLAGGLAAAGWDEEDVIGLVETICAVTGDEDEVARQDRTLAVHSTFERHYRNENIKGFPSLAEVMPPQVVVNVRFWLGATKTGINRRLNDAGNADRFLEREQHDVRYHADGGCWLIWNGMYWERDITNSIHYRARAVQDMIHEEANQETDPKTQQDFHRFAITTGNSSRIEGLINMAKTDPAIAITTESLDQHPLKFNCANGTLDLETMGFDNNRREDYLTLRSPVRYDKNAKPFDAWEHFLDDLTDGDPDRRRFLQKAAGYTMTGSTQEEVFFFAYGPAATGKTTFLEALRMVMGTYAQTLNPETLLMGRSTGSGGPRPDLAKLRGARFVTAVEVDEGRRMAVALLKQLTGGDYISARFLHQNEIEFQPVLKLWIAANDTPYASGTDEGMRRRFIRVPFDHRVPVEKRDMNLKILLSDPQVAGPSILNWMVEGYKMWKQEGLGVAKVRAIVRSNEQYWEEVDPLKDFISECCAVDQNVSEFAGTLRQEYVDWAKRSGMRIINDTEWGKQMRAHGFESCWKGKKKGWRGLRVDMNRHQLVDMTDAESAD